MGRDQIDGRRRPAATLVLALAHAFACPGCCSDGEVWSFGLSRELYADAGSRSSSPPDRHRENLAGRQALPPEIGGVIFVLFAAPLLVDVALLPVTGLHDIMLPILPSPSEDDVEETPLRPPYPPPRRHPAR